MNIRSKYQKSVIYKYTLDGRFVSSYSTCVEAGKKNYLYPRVIEKCCRGEHKSAGGFQWRRVEPGHSTRNIEKLSTGNGIKYLPMEIDQFDINETYIKSYPSIRSAAKDIGIDPKDIREVLKGHQKRAGGFIWKKKEKKI